jgi:ABC-2 type transport system ATP-binding protein
MINVRNVYKTFKGKDVLADVSMTFGPGRVVGLAGPNGSGKTMLMRIVCGLVKPTRGSVEVDGKTVGRELAFPPSLGLLLEGPTFINGYSGFDNLKALAAIRGSLDDAQIRSWIGRVGLDPTDRRHYRRYSLGMKQRLGIAAALMESPDVVMLDEPTNALDSDGVQMVRREVEAARDRGATVVLACHDASVLRDLSNEIWYLAEGHIERHEEVRHAC